MFVRSRVLTYKRQLKSCLVKILFSMVVFIFSQSSGYSKSHSIELSYGRIHLNFISDDSSVYRNKPFVDSIFRIAEINFQDLEVLLGYKSGLQYTATIYSDINDYHSALKQNSAWLERISGTVQYSQENNYPIYVNSSFEQIKSQFVYTLSHFIFHEFLLGISVRQKLSQTGFHTMPNWFLQGLESHLAAGWNSNSADEYSFYESKGGFKSPNQIVPMGAQVYGNKIWRELFQTYGKSVVSTMMFVLKYTGNAESAIEYVTGKPFNIWNNERIVEQQHSLETSTTTEIDLPLKYRTIPIRKIIKHNDNLVIHWFSPGLVKISLYNSISQKVVDLVNYEYPVLFNEVDFQPLKLVGFLSDQNCLPNPVYAATTLISIELMLDHKRTLVFIDSLGKILQWVDLGREKIFPINSSLTIDYKSKQSENYHQKIINLTLNYTTVGHQMGENNMIKTKFFLGEDFSTTFHKTGITLKEFLNQGFAHFYYVHRPSSVNDPITSKVVTVEKLLTERLDFANEPKDSIYYAIDLQKIEKDHWVMLFNQLDGAVTKTLRADTLFEKPIVRGLVIEGQGQLSYVQSEGEVWRLRFYHFKDNSYYRWQSEVKFSFYTQSRVAGIDNIIESSFGSSLTSVRILDPAKESLRELELLAKNDGIGKLNKLALPLKRLMKSEDIDTTISTWEYLVVFPKRNWHSTLENEKFNHYSGKYDSSVARNTFYLSHGGLFFGNGDYSQLSYLNEISPHLLYNQPLTPEMRFYLMDKNHSYRLSFGVLSNIALNRLGLRLNQSFNWGRYQIDQQLLLRNRTFNINEMALKKNATNFFSVLMRRNWVSNFTLSSGVQVTEDSYFDKVVNPGFTSFKNNKFQTAGMVFGLDWNNRQKSVRREYSWHILLSSTIKINRINTAKIIPNRVYVDGNSMGNSYLYHITLKINKQLVRGIYLNSIMMANKSAGNVLTLFWVGGSEGWISKDMWQTGISSEYSNSKYLYRANGGFVRGFFLGDRIGTGSISIQNEIQWQPVKQFGKKIIKQNFYESLSFYGFLDIGTAFIGNSPANPANPFNTVLITTPNYLMSVTSKRNPYLIGTGLGVSTNVLRTPIRYELAFGLKEGILMPPIQQVCMSWFF